MPLAREGYSVTGLDASRALLTRAHEQSTDSGPTPWWVQGDLRSLPFGPGFDVVIVKDAFGYFDREGEDLEFLRAVRELLAPGGHVILRNPNAAWLGQHWKDELHEEGPDGPVEIQNRREGNWLVQDVRISDSGTEHQYTRRQIIYDITDLTDLLNLASFREVHHFADAKGTSSSPDSFHIVSVAQRPR